MAGWLTRVLVLLLLSVQPVMALESINVVGLFGKKALLEIDGQRRMVQVGEKSPEGVLLLAVDSESILVQYQGKKERIELGSQSSGAISAPSVREERYWPDNHGLYRANGTINGHSVNFLIDTGANLMAMNSGLAQRLGIDYKRGAMGRVETASDVVTAYQVTLDLVQAGSLQQRNVQAVVLEGSQPQEVLLGMSFLSRVDMQREGTMMVLRQKW